MRSETKRVHMFNARDSKMFSLLLVLPISGGLALRGDEEGECSGERWGRKSAIAFRSTDFR